MTQKNYFALGLGLLSLALGAHQAAAQLIYTPYEFGRFAGQPGTPGAADGGGNRASFNSPVGAAVDRNGNLYVADLVNRTVRKITPERVVTTLAGSPGVQGTNDGAGSAARFMSPAGVAVDGADNVYVADQGGNTIRKISPEAVVTTVAGLGKVAGSNDGAGAAARFFGPQGVAVDSSNNVYVSDTGNHTIRMISPAGQVTTLAGRAGQNGSADGINDAARFDTPRGIAVDRANNLYVAGSAMSVIRKLARAGNDWQVTTLAGQPGRTGNVDGPGFQARFHLPYGLALDDSGSICVADSGNHTIRKLIPNGKDWVVTTLGGSPGQAGAALGSGGDARFDTPMGVALDREGNLYVVDSGEYRVLKGARAPIDAVAQYDSSAGMPHGVFQVQISSGSGTTLSLAVSTNAPSGHQTSEAASHLARATDPPPPDSPNSGQPAPTSAATPSTADP